MSQGRHHQSGTPMRHGQLSRSASRRRRRTRLWSAVALVVGVSSVGAYLALPHDDAVAGGREPSVAAAADCTSPVPVSVAVAAEDAGPMEALAAQLSRRDEGSALPCVELTVVRSRFGADGAIRVPPTASAIFGGVGPMGALGAGVAANGGTLTERTTVATTRAVLAMPQPLVQAARWTDGPVSWGEISTALLDPSAWTALGRPELGAFTVSLADPRTAAATRAGLLGLASAALGQPMNVVTAENLTSPEVQAALLTLDRQVTRSSPDTSGLVEALTAADVAGALVSSTSVVFLDERTVWSYNSQDPATALVAVYPEGGAASLDLSWATVDSPDVPPGAHDAAGQIGTYLLSADGQALLADQGLRRLDGAPSEQLTTAHGITPDGGGEALRIPSAVLDASAAGWMRLKNPGRFLVLIDVSGSMADEVAGTGRTKLQFAQDAAIAGVRLVPAAADIGLWEFSTALDGANDYHELVSVGRVGALVGDRTRLDRLTDAIGGLTPRADTALYDTALAAFRSMRATYQPGEPNVIILITDGTNDDANSIGLDALLTAIAAEQDEAAPVRLITLAYGADADTDSLGRIAAASGGTAFTSPNPADIGTVFFKALNAG